MVRARNPTVRLLQYSDKRDGECSAVSPRAYCAVWTAMRTPQTFGAAASPAMTRSIERSDEFGDQYLADKYPFTMLG